MFMKLGYVQYDKWGQEGAWRFEPVVNATKIVSGERGKSGWGHPSFFAKNNSTGRVVRGLAGLER